MTKVMTKSEERKMLAQKSFENQRKLRKEFYKRHPKMVYEKKQIAIEEKP